MTAWWRVLMCMAVTSGTRAAVAQQAPVTARSESQLLFEVGIEQWAQRVPVVSISAFQGWGEAGTVRYEHLSAESSWGAWLTFETAGLGPTEGQSHSHDRVFEGSLGALRYWRTPWKRGGLRADVGVRLDATVQATVHRYAFPFDGVNDVFGFTLLAASPTLRLARNSANGTFTNDLAIPIAGAADFPYANYKASGFFPLRPVTINTLQALDERLSYHRQAGGVAMEWSYHVVWRRIVAADVRRFARQEVTAALRIPVGRREP